MKEWYKDLPCEHVVGNLSLRETSGRLHLICKLNLDLQFVYTLSGACTVPGAEVGIGENKLKRYNMAYSLKIL